MSSLRSLAVVAASSVLMISSARAVDFRTQLMPFLTQKCSECHSSNKKVKGKFDIGKTDTYAKFVKAGNPENSGIMNNVTAADDNDDVMPPKGKNRLTPQQVELLKTWIQEGANFAPGKPGAAPSAPAAPAAAAGGLMKWTNTAGKSLDAAFDRLEGDAVVLKATDGKYYTVPLANLDAASQDQAKKAGGQ